MIQPLRYDASVEQVLPVADASVVLDEASPFEAVATLTVEPQRA